LHCCFQIMYPSFVTMLHVCQTKCPCS
jgi:hypothetical protein